jgi:hypothetical protein
MPYFGALAPEYKTMMPRRRCFLFRNSKPSTRTNPPRKPLAIGTIGRRVTVSEFTDGSPRLTAFRELGIIVTSVGLKGSETGRLNGSSEEIRGRRRDSGSPRGSRPRSNVDFVALGRDHADTFRVPRERWRIATWGNRQQHRLELIRMRVKPPKAVAVCQVLLVPATSGRFRSGRGPQRREDGKERRRR